MEIVKTASFDLAINKYGDERSERLLLCLPGRLDTKDYTHIESHANYFSKRGFLTVAFDPPGTWESPGDISLYTTPNYLKAINELIDYFGNRPTVILGHSRGGTMAMLSGIQNKYVTHFVAVMSRWGPSSKPNPNEVVHISHRDMPPGLERTTEQKRFDLPVSYFDDPTKYVGLDTCTKPKLFFAGRRDTLATPDDVRATFELAAEPKQFYEVDSEHDYRLHSNIIDEINRKVETFLLES